MYRNIQKWDFLLSKVDLRVKKMMKQKQGLGFKRRVKSPPVRKMLFKQDFIGSPKARQGNRVQSPGNNWEDPPSKLDKMFRIQASLRKASL